MTYTVEVAGLSKSFGRTAVLHRVDLAVEAGTVLGLLGPNGAGKTTLVRILATLLRPDSGSAMIAGHDLRTDPAAVRRSISLTGQFSAVDHVLTGRENLRMMAQLLRVPRRTLTTTVDDLLGRFDLSGAADRRVSTYSGGMRRRLDIAINMITPSALIFLDEPTTGLDPRSREQVWRTVEGLTSDGVSVLLTTQYLQEADQLADSIAVLDHGRVVARGTPPELKAQLGGEVLRLQFDDLRSARMAASLLTDGELDEELFACTVPTDGTAHNVSATLDRLRADRLPAARISLHRPTLDDVFLSLTHKDHVS